MDAREEDYIVWQNRAFSFYLAARLLARNMILRPAAFSAHQAIELLMKATLIYWDRSFNPRQAGHGLAKMRRMIRNKVTPRPTIDVPSYFFHDRRYLSVTRYPGSGKGVSVPFTLLHDLDKIVADLVRLVPFQFNSDLIHVLRGRNKYFLRIMRQGNHQMRPLRRFLKAKLRVA
jgi:HEPN domain-containing protein